MERKSHDRGFTLIEIIIVIGIVAGLAAVLFTSYNTTMKKTRDGRRKADLSIIRTAIENYKMDFGGYPPNPNPAPKYEVPSSIVSPDLSVKYLTLTPKDPLYKPNGFYYYCYVPGTTLTDGTILSYTLSSVFELETSECPGQPTGTPTPIPRPTPTQGPTPTPGPPTATPTPTMAPTATPTPTSVGLCTSGTYVKTGGTGDCATDATLSSYGVPVGDFCDTQQCGFTINYCHESNPSCPQVVSWGEGRSFTTCTCQR